MAGQFEIYKDGNDFRFRLTGDEREILAVSGAFPGKMQAAKAIMAVRENAATGHIVDKSIIEEQSKQAGKAHSPLTRSSPRQSLRTAMARGGETASKRSGPRRGGPASTRGLKLRFLVRLNLELDGARVLIRGRVSEHNLTAIYAVARRAAALPGRGGVVLDLTGAAVGGTALRELRSAALKGELPGVAGRAAVPCKLDILEPVASHMAKAASLPG
ncbi:YegP family protein [Paenarthrobacter ureafaciens]|jgi:uncharacterized protein YegP (UPF0339 family)|uniref:YegP family protein n=1 Tax=Paenarthrobacter sp. PAE-2 TaxID=2982532 RepID=UPI00223248CA|nr:DUF1508 domain-containing protein [Paenarthrobacter sp. PAE-2]MCW3767736.1 DUF1508 domain-containing protein [Paenarthrobacter sp. PAE-2]